MEDDSKSRRAFLKLAAGTAALAGRATHVLAEDAAPNGCQPTAGGERLGIALVGAGGQGNSDVRAALKVPGVQLVGVADIYDGRLQRAKEAYCKDVLTTRDHRELIARKDVDAILIATPDHWHSRIAIDALNAGKDVYCQKPMTQTVEEGQQLVAAQKKTGKLVQVGSQRVSSIIYAKARDLMKAGAIGELFLVEAWWNRNSALGAWQYTIPADASPANVDWDRFLGHAPKRPFEPIRLFRWRNYNDYGTGVAGDLFVHLFSGLHAVTGSHGPTRIVTTGGLRYWKDGRDAADVMLGLYNYPKNERHPEFNLSLKVNFADHSGGEEGFRFLGTEGVMTILRDGVSITKRTRDKEPGYTIDTFPKAAQEAFLNEYRQKYPPTEDLGTASEERYMAPRGYSEQDHHLRNFIESVRTRKAVVEDAVFGLRAAAPALLSNTSLYEGRAVTWNPEAMRIESGGHGAPRAAAGGEPQLTGAAPAAAGPTRAAFTGVALISLGGLMLQLALTRLFSATMYYHFAFLAISLALFGSGAGGVMVYVYYERLRKQATASWLAAAALATAAGTVLALVVVLTSPLSPVDPGAVTFRRLLRIYVASALPFFFAGSAIAMAVTRYATEISRLYLFDLAGAALGCLLLIPAVNTLGAVDTVLLVAVVSSLAAVSFALAGARPGLKAASLAAVLACAGLLAWNGATRTLDVRKAKGLEEKGNVIFSKWNSFSRVTVWGSLENAAVHIMIDADAATLISRDGGKQLPQHAPLANGVEALAYRLRPGARAVIIGPGGGNDVIAARLLGAREIEAVEVNPIIAKDVMSSEPFKGYSGNLYEQPGITLVVAEARSYLRRSKEQYDIVQGTMVDTWAATAAGAYALAENNLYTVEAFDEYLDRLVPGGILSLTRWYLDPPDQLLRLFTIARAALAERGAFDAAQSLVLVRGYTEPGTTRAPATFLLKNGRFTPAELDELESAAARSGFTVLYSPRSTDEASPFAKVARAADPEQVWKASDGDIAPTRDDNPFFFHTVRLKNLGSVLDSSGEWRKTNLGTFVLLSLLLLSFLLSAAFILGPLVLVRNRLRSLETRPTLAWLLYFACLGAGFIIVEVTLVQKTILFLGHPVYALTVVLFALLIFSAIGSRISGRIADADLHTRLPALLGAVALLVLLSVWLLSPLYDLLVHLDQPLRIAVAVAALAPLGLAMGMPMPTAIRILAREAPELVPWGWGVNGAASVMGSVAALTIALLSGFNYALLVAAALYVAAILLVRTQPPHVTT